MVLNGNNNEYIVLFGTAKYRPESFYRTCQHRFAYLKEARKYAEGFSNAYIFRLHYSNGSDIPYITEIR